MPYRFFSSFYQTVLFGKCNICVVHINLFKLPGTRCVVYMAVGNQYDQGFLGQLFDVSFQIPYSIAGINQRRLFGTLYQIHTYVPRPTDTPRAGADLLLREVNQFLHLPFVKASQKHAAKSPVVLMCFHHSMIGLSIQYFLD
ncbi:hypothetical protein SDC9_138151 [bioreactor metagenome]|uniref:Uncharacterized protein n=1 Tax=bioreactor metagenome TaxID=1076179 RepID=A0A645DP12_9ZZZZ